MAMGKRGTRGLTVDGLYFRWRCDFHELLDRFSLAYEQHGKTWSPDTLVIRPEEGPHRLLTVTWPACRGPIVKPGLVRAGTADVSCADGSRTTEERMSYNVAIVIPPIPTADDEAWAALDGLIDQKGARPAIFQELHDRWTIIPVHRRLARSTTSLVDWS